MVSSSADRSEPVKSLESSLTVGSSANYHALIHQAAFDYYSSNNYGLSRPPKNDLLTPQVKIAAKEESWLAERSHAAIYYSYVNTYTPMGLTPINLPDLFIRTFGDESERTYAVTAHELAHMAHWFMDKDAFTNLVFDAYSTDVPGFGEPGDERTIESWAEGVEWRFAIGRYLEKFGDPNYDYEDNRQDRTIADEPIYTSVVIDLIDNVNQRNTPFFDNRLPDDNVSGYTIDEIEDALRGARSWNGWRDQIIDRLNNPTENQVNGLFTNWN